MKEEKDISKCVDCKREYYLWELSDDLFCERCNRNYSKIIRTKRYSSGGNELIKIKCKNCERKKGIRKKGSLKVNCIICNKFIGEFEF